MIRTYRLFRVAPSQLTPCPRPRTKQTSFALLSFFLPGRGSSQASTSPFYHNAAISKKLFLTNHTTILIANGRTYSMPVEFVHGRNHAKKQPSSFLRNHNHQSIALPSAFWLIYSSQSSEKTSRWNDPWNRPIAPNIYKQRSRLLFFPRCLCHSQNLQRLIQVKILCKMVWFQMTLWITMYAKSHRSPKILFEKELHCMRSWQWPLIRQLSSLPKKLERTMRWQVLFMKNGARITLKIQILSFIPKERIGTLHQTFRRQINQSTIKLFYKTQASRLCMRSWWKY